MKAAIFIILVLSSCASNKLASDINAIRFGSGGGFTGEIHAYELTPNGELSIINQQDTVLYKKISRLRVNEILAFAETIKSFELNEPENMYRFIEIDHGQSTTNRLVWGLGHKDLPAKIDSLYYSLTALLN